MTAPVLGFFALAAVATLLAAEPAPQPRSPGHIDHVILGVADLDRGVEAFEKATGVRPVYGGKHPTGTHNALVSLGGGTYLELIAPQPGAAPSPVFGDLSGLKSLTPVGWAVSGADPEILRRSLREAGFETTPPQPGSRTTPAGAVLHWETFGLAAPLEEAPFFIVWSPETEHPSKSSPAGCELRQWTVAGPHAAEMRRFRDALGLAIEVREAVAPSLALSLDCPQGTVTFAADHP